MGWLRECGNPPVCPMYLAACKCHSIFAILQVRPAGPAKLPHTHTHTYIVHLIVDS